MRNSEVKRPILRYHGGKFILAKWIISHFPPHRNYVEAFGGAGSVLLQKARSHQEVYNDKWSIVVNVFRVLRDPALAARLKELLILTPYSREEFDLTYSQADNVDPVEMARQTILRSFAGFGSASTSRTHRTGFRANNCSNGTNCAVDWSHFPDHINSFTERLRGVVIENKDYRDIFKQQDTPDTLFFLDPPYVHDTRNIERANACYAFEMTDQDHIDMANAAKALRGGMVISGYPSELYNDIFKDWVRVDRKALADGAAPRIECLWLNPAAAAQGNKKLF